MRLFLLGAFIILAIPVFCQPNRGRFICHFLGKHPDSVDVTLPIARSGLNLGVRKIPVGGDGRVVLTLDDTLDGFVNIQWAERSVRVFVKRGTTVRAAIDSNASGPVKFSGPNATGQPLISFQNLVVSYFNMYNLFSRDSANWPMLKADLARQKAIRLAPFRDLFEQKAIDSSFFKYARIWIDCLYNSVASETGVQAVLSDGLIPSKSSTGFSWV